MSNPLISNRLTSGQFTGQITRENGDEESFTFENIAAVLGKINEMMPGDVISFIFEEKPPANVTPLI